MGLTVRTMGAALACLLSLTPACGSDSDQTATSQGPATTATLDSPTSGPPASPATTVPLTTPFTFAPRDTTPFSPGEGTMTVTGDQQATAQFSANSCTGITVTAPKGVLAALVFVSNPNLASSRRYLLELAGISPGSTTFPEPAGFNQIPPRRVRLSVESIGQVLTWGTNAAGEGTVTGTVTAKVTDAKSGAFDLQLGFAGSEGNTVPPGSRGPVQIKGSWSCPTA